MRGWVNIQSSRKSQTKRIFLGERSQGAMVTLHESWYKSLSCVAIAPYRQQEGTKA